MLQEVKDDGNWANKDASPLVPSQNHMQEVSEVLLPVSCQQLGVWQPTSLRESHSWPMRFKFSLQLLKCRCVLQNINRPIRWESLCDVRGGLRGIATLNWRETIFYGLWWEKVAPRFYLRIFTLMSCKCGLNGLPQWESQWSHDTGETDVTSQETSWTFSHAKDTSRVFFPLSVQTPHLHRPHRHLMT